MLETCKKALESGGVADAEVSVVGDGDLAVSLALPGEPSALEASGALAAAAVKVYEALGPLAAPLGRSHAGRDGGTLLEVFVRPFARIVEVPPGASSSAHSDDHDGHGSER